MNRLKFCTTLLFLSMCVFSTNAQRNIDYVNPMVGTKSMGHTFPGACAPFGLVQLSPDTEMVPHNIDGIYQDRKSVV
jgi:putative alpha-1,2-mannosidase